MSLKMSSSKPKRTKTSANSSITAISHSTLPLSYSSEKIANNDDILTEILVRLPIKSLLKFKSVSKQWLSLISDPNFSYRRTRCPSPISGLFSKRLDRDSGCGPIYDFVDLNTSHNSSGPPFRSLTFANEYRTGIRILQSFNGLLLCCTSHPLEVRRSYYVYNPSTKQYCTILPRPLARRGATLRTVFRMALAFDPSKSPHYKVVCVRNCEKVQGRFQIQIYSSGTRCWRGSALGSFSAEFNLQFDGGVFWNGAVHWVNTSRASLYFKVNEEQLCEMPMPNHDLDNDFEDSDWKLGYSGESRDHLHLIYRKNERRSTCFDVYEMDRDYSRWFIKYRIDLSEVSVAFPEMISSFGYCRPGFEDYLFSVLCIVRDELDEDSYLVLYIPGKVLRYNFKSETFFKLCDIECDRGFRRESWVEMFERSYETYQFIESLASV